jgi:hypothetical protein
MVVQSSTSAFNRGILMNIGFVEALKQRHWDCFIFHDVDLLPQNDGNIYSCPAMPCHMSVAVDALAYRSVCWSMVSFQINGHLHKSYSFEKTRRPKFVWQHADSFTHSFTPWNSKCGLSMCCFIRLYQSAVIHTSEMESRPQTTRPRPRQGLGLKGQGQGHTFDRCRSSWRT